MILFDSNIWIYLLDRDTPENKVVDTRLATPLRKETVIVPTLVQTEVLHYIARQLKRDAASVIAAFLAFPANVHDLTQEDVRAGGRILIERAGDGIGARDAMILATTSAVHATLATHDAALMRAAKSLGLDVWDPIQQDRP